MLPLVLNCQVPWYNFRLACCHCLQILLELQIPGKSDWHTATVQIILMAILQGWKYLTRVDTVLENARTTTPEIRSAIFSWWFLREKVIMQLKVVTILISSSAQQHYAFMCVWWVWRCQICISCRLFFCYSCQIHLWKVLPEMIESCKCLIVQ